MATNEETETRAKEMGWVNEDDWVGDPPPHGFLSAEDFVTRGETVLPIIQAQNRELRDELKALKQTAQDFQQFSSRALEREKKETQNAIGELERVRADAITEGDGEKAVDAERKITELRTEQATPDPQVEAQIGAWLDDNSWFNTDPIMRQWADGRAMQLGSEGVAPGIATLNRLAAEAKEAFPDRFKPTPTPPSPESGGRRKAGGNGKTWADLPADAKKDYAEFKDLMPDYKQQDYLDLYEWPE